MKNFQQLTIGNFLGDPDVPIHYQEYLIDTIPRPSSYIGTKVFGTEFYTPEATHHMYVDFDSLPPFATLPNQAQERLLQFSTAGYTAIAGVMTRPGTTIAQGIKFHEKGTQYIKEGCLIGPYFDEDRLVLNAFKFFRK